MKVIDFVEGKINVSSDDMTRLMKEIDLNKHWLLSAACAEWINPIEDDRAMLTVEWNFMHYWFAEKGFTENDYRYIEACGYERDQFRKEAI